MYAALTSAVGRPVLRVARCAMRPECQGGCEEACLKGMDPSWVAEHAILLPRRPAAISNMWVEV
jgi:hypothetical protein